MEITEVTNQLLESIDNQIVELYGQKASKANIDALFRIRDAIITEIGLNKVSSKLELINHTLADPITGSSVTKEQLEVLSNIEVYLKQVIFHLELITGEKYAD